MNRRKIFIGIDLPSDVKKRLTRKIEPWKELPVKWVRENNFHVTLAFLGYVDDDRIFEICSAVKNGVGGNNVFELQLESIELAPVPEIPQMVWAIGPANEELLALQEDIEQELGIFVKEKKAFRPHVTLGRIRAMKWDALPEKPIINESLIFSVPVEQVTIFESRMENGKQMYTPLEVCELR